jgi:phosphohistidine phosphatase
MKRLCIMRHAKSDWSNPELADSARTLNARGVKSAEFLAGFIVENGWTPDHAMCSTAVRARSTIEPLAARLGDACDIQYRDDLYMAMPQELVSFIRDLSDTNESVLIVAHNPGLEMLAVDLADDESTEAANKMADHFPTGALAVFLFDVDSWADVKSGTGRVLFYGKPRELMAERES